MKGFEQDKIACGEKHFELIEDLDYDVCVDYDEFAYNIFMKIKFGVFNDKMSKLR